MSIQSRYRHTLVVKALVPGSVDDWNHPATTTTTLATVKGLIQPRRAREAALASQAGVVLGDHVGYLDPLAALTTHHWIEKDGVRYDIEGINDAGGVGHHYELDLKRVS